MDDVDRLLEQLFAVLDWSALGAIYCDEGGDAFWTVHRGPALRLGKTWASAVSRRVQRGGRSLYVGAGVAELPAMLREVRALGRRVVACNLRQAECACLDAGLRAVGVLPEDLAILPQDARELLDRGPFDHLSIVSVLSDPETWPTTSAVTYGRVPPVLLDLAAFERERQELLALTGSLCAALTREALVTTTGDEAPWFAHIAAARGLRVETDDESLASAIVGDPIGFLRLG